jgi:hypothetical protein
VTTTSDLYALRTAVYRYFDATGCLLYVGASHDPDGRHEYHQRFQPWWPDVDPSRTRVEWFPTRQKALSTEALAIRTENPLHNSAGVPGVRRPSTAKAQRTGGRHANPSIAVRPPVEVRDAALDTLALHDRRLQDFVTAALTAVADDPGRVLELLGKYWPPPAKVGRPRKADPPAGG